jgi:hypothetical protein
VLPDARDRLAEVTAAIGPESDAAGTTVHGDYYEGQLIVRGGRIAAVLDVDTMGRGRPADDPATLLGHLSVLGDGWPAGRRNIHAHADVALRLFDQRLDPADLRRRAAAVVLGLATGPFRVQAPSWPAMVRQRIALAVRWVESATAVADRLTVDAIGESHLTGVPRSSHAEARA